MIDKTNSRSKDHGFISEINPADKETTFMIILLYRILRCLLLLTDVQISSYVRHPVVYPTSPR